MNWGLAESSLRLLVGIGAGVVFLLAGLVRERQVAQQKTWRYLTLVLSASALVILIVKPGWDRQVDGATALLLTPGANPESLQDIDKEIDSGVLSASLPGTEPGSAQTVPIPDLATWLRSNPQIVHLRIAGDGLDPWDLAELPQTVEVAGRVTRRIGVRSVHWNRRLSLGDWLEVTGSVTFTEIGSLTVELEGPGGPCASIELSAEAPEQALPFSLRCKPPGEGRFLYRLDLKDHSDVLRASETVAVQVDAAETPSLLWIEDSPSFEARHFKEWIAGTGGGLAIRSRVSRNRFHFEFHNMESFELQRLSSEILERFDLVVVGQRAWNGLSEPERQVLIEDSEIRSLGLLFRARSGIGLAGGEGWPFGFIAEEVAGSEGLQVRVAGLGTEQTPTLDTGPFELRLEPGMEPIFEDQSGRVVAAARPLGAGTVGITLMDKTYPWLLGGQGETYRQLWRELVEVVARPRDSPVWRIPPGPVLVDEPLPLSLELISGDPVPAAVFGTINGSLADLPLRQDPTRPYRWTGTVWPAETGWHRLSTAGSKLDLYADEAGSWTAWQQARKERATRLASLRGRDPRSETATVAEVPIPRLPVYLVLLAGLGLLWLDERR